MLFRALLYNIIQRASLVCVTLFAFLASGGNPGLSVDMFVVKCMVILGSNTVPIPGAMGVIDYLLLDAFGGFVDSATSVNLELLARTVSFYFCVLLCGIVFIVRLISMQITKRKK